MKRRFIILFLVFVLLIPTTVYGKHKKNTKPMTPIIFRNGIRISSLYGYRIHPITGNRRFHSGIDIAAPLGTHIHSILGGKVISVKSSNKGAGNEVRIYHGNGLISRYTHMYQRSVKAGDIVRRGQIIGTVGSTGNSTGPHLHFEIHKNGITINPINVVLSKF